MISNVWGGAPVAAVTLPGDRRDDLVIETAAALATWFSRVVIYEDDDRRGRAPGEMTELIGAALRRARPGLQCVAADGPAEALRRAVSMAGVRAGPLPVREARPGPCGAQRDRRGSRPGRRDAGAVRLRPAPRAGMAWPGRAGQPMALRPLVSERAITVRRMSLVPSPMTISGASR